MAANIDSQESCDLEDVQKANNELLDAKKLISRTRQENLKIIRQCTSDEVQMQNGENFDLVVPDNIDVFPTKEKFILVGRPELEQFFNDNIVDIVLNQEQYRRMGILFWLLFMALFVLLYCILKIRIAMRALRLLIICQIISI